MGKYEVDLVVNLDLKNGVTSQLSDIFTHGIENEVRSSSGDKVECTVRYIPRIRISTL